MNTSVRCPTCVAPTRVIETRARADGITRRRRICTRCVNRFTTWQEIGSEETTIQPAEPWIVLPDEQPLIDATGYYRHLQDLFAGTVTFAPPPDLDETIDFADDSPWSVYWTIELKEER